GTGGRHPRRDHAAVRCVRRADPAGRGAVRGAWPGAPGERTGSDRRGHRPARRGGALMVTLKTTEQIAKMREAGKIVAAMLATTRDAVRPGVTTAELDGIAAEVLARAGAKSSFLGYYGYPATICTSVNEQIVHGIPGKRKLREGDIIGIDAGAIVDGWHADAAITVPVGRVSAQADTLIRVTREALVRGIAAARMGNRLGDIGAAVQQYVEGEGFS